MSNVIFLLFFKALAEAAERFKELQTEREMRQLQEDRKNDKKPPPYKHIKVSSHAKLCFTVRVNVPLTCSLIPPFLR